MNEKLATLLQPTQKDPPCGPDLSYSALEELEAILKGKPEVEIGSIVKPAEPPDWGELRDRSIAFLSESKHLRAAIMLTCSLLRTDGLAGFRDGLKIVQGLLEQFWPNLYPLLDPEDNNDPTQRLNILGSLTAPRGSVFGSWLKITDYVYSAPICQPKGAAPVTLEQLQDAKQPPPAAADKPPTGPSLESLTTVLRAAGEQVAATREAAREALEAVKGIDQFLTTTLSAGKTINFEELTKTLQELITAIEPYVPGAQLESAAGAAASSDTQAESAGGISVSGPVRSREDVVKALERICAYYQQVEPGSPVPYLLRRAQKLAMMDFVQIVQELNLVADINALKPSMGSAVEGTTPAPGT